MATHTVKLTAEELELIENKRAEEKAAQEAILKSYDHYKANTIKQEEERIVRAQKEQEDKKKVYEDFFDSLTAISPVFNLDCKKIINKKIIELFELDENGFQIRYEYDKEGVATRSLKPKEKVTLNSYSYEIKLSYIGNLPEGYSFHVLAIPQHSKYRHLVVGYKMQIQGTGIASWDKKGQMTKPQTVVNKLSELAQNAFDTIEYKNSMKLRQQRIETEFQNKFGHLENEGVQIKINEFEFTLTYKNGIVLKIGAHESNGKVVFNNSKVTIPYDSDITKLVEGLKNI